MKPVVAFDNFPSFGNAGARTAPGEAKYAAGFVPADTFPAEWANYFFHGATKGISDLNSATRSIWLELENVLLAKNIQPSADASCTSQLLEALNKIRDDAVALAYPVGTVYMNAKSATLPDEIQAIGTWCAIDGRFLRACASCLGCTGGAGSVTLAVCNLPSHCHSMKHCHGYTPSGGVSSHCHSMGAHKHSGSVSVSCALSVSVSGSTGGMSANSTGYVYATSNGNNCGTAQSGNIGLNKVSCYGASKWVVATQGGNTCSALCVDVSHTHSFSGSGSATGGCFTFTGGAMCAAAVTGDATPTFTGTLANTADTYCASASDKTHALPNTGNTGSGSSFSILPPYRDVAMWYRDA